MIATAFEKFGAWFTSTVIPAATRWFRALYDDPLMHVVTGVVSVVAVKVVMIFW